MRDDNSRILDILEAIGRIERRAAVDRPAFDRDELIQTWMVHNLQIIGEAAAGISEQFRSRHPEVPWRSIAGMRNAIVHAYFRVDLDEVWNVIQNDLPHLKAWMDSAVTDSGDAEPVD